MCQLSSSVQSSSFLIRCCLEFPAICCTAKKMADQLQSEAPYKIATFDDWSPIALRYHPLQAGSIDGTDLEPHDKGIIRALRARYRPNKKVTGDPYKTLFVARLDINTKEETISDKFSKFGDLEKCRLVRDIITGNSRRYAFVEFKRERDARLAWREMNKAIIDGCEILVEYEKERVLKGWVPRRFGGGFGGRKESGQLRFGGRDRPFRRPLPVGENPLNRKNLSRGRQGSTDRQRDWGDGRRGERFDR